MRQQRNGRLQRPAEALFTVFIVGLLFPIGVASLPLYLLLGGPIPIASGE